MDFQKEYVLKKPPTGEGLAEYKELLKAHKKLIDNIHVCWNSDSLDTLLVSLGLLKNTQSFLGILDMVSKNKIFSEESTFQSKELYVTHSWNSSWFDPLDYNSLVEWMVYHFEKVVQLK